MKWTEIIGHTENIKMLRHLESKGRMSHAMLLSGPSGIGKFAVAMTLATALLCEATESRPCATCPSCVQMSHHTHPDCVVIRPDGANIKIDQIRALQHELAMAPYISSRRICIIDGAELMTVQATNSLLKVLEEPMGDIVFILVAANRQMLLPTIISRCMMIVFQPLTTAELTQALVDKGFLLEQVQVAARLSNGRMGIALMMLEPEGFSVRNQAVESFAALVEGNMTVVWDTAARFEKMERTELLQLLVYFTYILRDIVMVITEQEQSLLLNIDLAQWLSGQADRWSEERLLTALKIVESTRRALQGNANARLASEALLIKIYDLAREV